MVRLPEESRNRLDETVLLCASFFSDSRGTLQTLHFAKPDPFASFIVKYIPMHWDLRTRLQPEDFDSHTGAERLAIISATIRRLVRKGRLARGLMNVPVLVGRRRRAKGVSGRIIRRPMVCFWPTTILDRLANC